MFKGKPLLPSYLINYEFETYIILLFFSRFFPIFISPIIKFSVVSYYTEWLHEIYEIQQSKGILNVWTTYPFLFNLYSFILNYLAFNNLFIFSVLFYFVNAVSDSLTGILIWKLLEASPQYYSQYARWLYLFSPLPLFWIFSQQIYDPLVVFLLVFSAYLIKKYKKASSLLISLGTSLKIIPVFLFLSCIFDKHKRKFFFGTLVYLIIFLLLINFPIVFNLGLYINFIAWQSNRPAWESIFGLLEYISNGFYVPSGLYLNCPSDSFTLKLIGYHLIGITPCPTIFENKITTGLFPISINFLKLISLFLTGTFTVLFLVFSTNKQSFERISLGIISILFAFSFGFSPQYALYELVLIILALNSNKVVIYSSILQVLLLLEYPLVSIVLPLTFNLSIEEILFPYWLLISIRTVFFLYIALSLLLNKV